MSDRDIRDLERAHQEGDTHATELLIRALERAGDPRARCKVTGHAYGEPEAWLVLPKPASCGFSELVPGTIFRLNGITERCVRCSACSAEAAVHWVTHLFGTGLDHYLQRLHFEAFALRSLGEGVVYLQHDGTIEIIDPLYVDADRTSPRSNLSDSPVS